MELYVYCQSGHNFGLENLRRTAVICKKLDVFEPLLATADYRAASFAKAELGVKKTVGIDVIENLPNMMLRMDMLIFDSKEPNETMLTYMKAYCSHLYEVGVDIPYDIVDDNFFEESKKTIKKTFFFADDDYENELLDFAQDSSKQDMSLLMGHYFFMGNDDKLAFAFNEVIEDEEYEETIKQSEYLLTSSINACIESLASGNKPVYFQRVIKDNKGPLELLEKYNIPTASGENLDALVEDFEKIIASYPKTLKVEKFDMSAILSDIQATMKKYARMIQ
ncbi:MAG TPA: hypothetical protein EYG97_03935 [Arcobacter sp.]|nr:hypothetical protein [Arcobacter sp.]HIP56153.1 hypothetical protein [Arcobacter sp.]